MKRMHPRMWSLAPVISLAALWGCSSGSPEYIVFPVNYYQDVQPIIQTKCSGCHNPQGIGPFPLQTAADVTSRTTLIRAAVAAKTMPPWPPADSCGSYLHDRSLTPQEITTITDWIDQGAPLGNPANQVTGQPDTGLSRVDFSVPMLEPFTPTESPDQYRCFLLPWPQANSTYVTGFGVRPGDPHIVHHAIAFIAAPDQVAQYQAMDAADPGAGWDCFGGPGIAFSQLWLGAWAPGTTGTDFPADTGVPMAAGSQIILQIHYNTSATAPAPDQTTLDFEIADTVGHPAVVQPFTDPDWLNGSMDIPAGNPDVVHSFSMELSPFLALASNNVLQSDVPTKIWSSFLHMHTRGSKVLGELQHFRGSTECLLDIEDWSFSWQGSYTFSEPKVMQPTDQLYLECHWDNTAAHQPIINGVQVPPMDLNWGETTEEEMCLEILYMTQ